MRISGDAVQSHMQRVLMRLTRGLKDISAIGDHWLMRCRYLYSFLPKEKKQKNISDCYSKMIINVRRNL